MLVDLLKRNNKSVLCMMRGNGYILTIKKPKYMGTLRKWRRDIALRGNPQRIKRNFEKPSNVHRNTLEKNVAIKNRMPPQDRLKPDISCV